MYGQVVLFLAAILHFLYDMWKIDTVKADYNKAYYRRCYVW